MSDDIRPGDVVVHVGVPAGHGYPVGGPQDRLRRNKTFRCLDVITHSSWPYAGLRLDGFASSHPMGLWASIAFRKLPPADEQFTQQMRACRPAREPVLATHPQTKG